MGKKGKGGPKSNHRNPRKQASIQHVAADDMDDEIDAFHKQREIIPLDINQDIGDSDEDDVHPVFDDEDINDDEEEDDDDDDDAQLTGLAAKMARQDKYLRAKTGGVEDDMHEHDEESKIKENWGAKHNYWHGDNADYELQSSDEEGLKEEETEVIRLQDEKAKQMSKEDFAPDDDSQEDRDEEPTLEEISAKGKRTSKSSFEKDAKKESGAAFEEIKKDLNSLSREEQMDVVYSSAPELVGLLSELNDALDQLENKVNPLLSKVKGEVNVVKGGMHYLEVKQALLLSYCQAINFYLLLKSEGQSVRDHPVIARLVEIKSLLDKLKELEEPLAFEFEEILNRNDEDETELKFVSKKATLASETHGITVSNETSELVPVELLKDPKVRGEKLKLEVDKVGIQSKEMLKVRAALEEKLKQKGILSSNSMKVDKAQKKRSRPVNSQLETQDDFDDETGIDGLNNEHSNSLRHKVSQRVTYAKMRMPKVVSGDDDLPQRDDIGERRRKHELHVLAGAGVYSDDENDNPEDDVDVEMEENNEFEEESEEDFYKQVEECRAAKIAAKEKIYSSSRPLAADPSLPETTVDGKRQISYQMEKNKGLTRHRKKQNPRKEYKMAYQKAAVRRKGQVRDIKKPAGPYGGEASGINTRVSKSVRFKN